MYKMKYDVCVGKAEGRRVGGCVRACVSECVSVCVCVRACVRVCVCVCMKMLGVFQQELYQSSADSNRAVKTYSHSFSAHSLFSHNQAGYSLEFSHSPADPHAVTSRPQSRVTVHKGSRCSTRKATVRSRRQDKCKAAREDFLVITTTGWVLLSVETAVLVDVVGVLEDRVEVEVEVDVDVVDIVVTVDVEARVVDLVGTGCSDGVIGEVGEGEVTSSG